MTCCCNDNEQLHSWHKTCTAHAHNTCTHHLQMCTQNMHTSHETTVFSDGSCADKMLHGYSTHRRNIHNSYTHIHKPYIHRTTHINFKCDRTRHDSFFSKTQAKFQKRFNCYSASCHQKMTRALLYLVLAAQDHLENYQFMFSPSCSSGSDFIKRYKGHRNSATGALQIAMKCVPYNYQGPPLSLST